MKFAFVTCVELGLSCIEKIYQIGGTLDLVITLEDKIARSKSGRVYVDAFCQQYGIELHKCGNINEQSVVDLIKMREIDWLFIIGWSQIAHSDVLAAPKRGVLGMHPTLLPEGRGRAAIPWAILYGLEKTGVTLFQLDGGVDTGPIIAQKVITLNGSTSATELYNEVEAAHVALIRDTFHKLVLGKLIAQPQDDALATEWPQRRPENGEINLLGSVKNAERLVRATTHPYPGAYVLMDKIKRIIWKAKIADEKDDHADLPEVHFSDGILICLEWNDYPLDAKQS